MAHDTNRKVPCALPDGHNGRHRSAEGLQVARESKYRYRHSPRGLQTKRTYAQSPKGQARAHAWMENNPMKKALSDIKYYGARRGENHGE